MKSKLLEIVRRKRKPNFINPVLHIYRNCKIFDTCIDVGISQNLQKYLNNHSPL